MPFSQDSYQGQGIETPNWSNNKVPELLSRGFSSMSQGIGQGIKKFNQNKAERKALLSFAKAATDMERELGVLTPEQAAQRLDSFESMSLPEMRGVKNAMMIADTKRQLKQADDDAKQRQSLASAKNAREEEMHQRRLHSINREERAQTQTGNVLLESLKEPEPETIVNVPEPGPGNNIGVGANEWFGTIETNTPTKNEMLLRAFKANPDAKVQEVFDQLASSKPSTSDMIAVNNYNAKQEALLVDGVGQARTEDEAKKARTLKTSVESGVPKIRELIKIAVERSNFTLDQKARGRADVMHNQLVAELKETLVGSGAVSESEWDILYKTIRHPLKGWSDGSVVSSLEQLESDLIKKLDNTFKNTIKGYKPGSYSIPDKEKGTSNSKAEAARQGPPTKVKVTWGDMVN